MMKVGPRVRSVIVPTTTPTAIAARPASGVVMNGEMPK